MNNQALRVLYHLMLGIKMKTKCRFILTNGRVSDCTRRPHPQIQKLNVYCKFRVFIGVEINNLTNGNFKKHGFYHFCWLLFRKRW